MSGNVKFQSRLYYPLRMSRREVAQSALSVNQIASPISCLGVETTHTFCSQNKRYLSILKLMNASQMLLKTKGTDAKQLVNK